ncbi:diguanylate cyclase [Aliikangiella sp. G2MR2-5]|uniref:sensor domain-containing diguanylate cyclase n=1 Tax=Aliikangiella sp. G2MR2-5 TaxID=2788943 RepID=UPI0018AC4FDB|nr:diguanylate cyclase [Aliikangiella sp. G2MR2-5]
MNNLWGILVSGIFLFFCCAQTSYAQQENSEASIQLNHEWQFCPLQGFQPELNLNILDCKPIELPVPWESVVPEYNGYGVLKSQFIIPKTLSGQALALYIPKLRDADKIFINRELIGQTGEFPPNFQKAVLYSRLYQIPEGVIDFERPNEINIWIYNDARNGGITQALPTIGTYKNLLEKRVWSNYRFIAFMVITFVFAFIHLIYAIYYRHARENIYYAMLLFAWSGYLFTFSDIALESPIPVNILFRTNVALFFAIFTLLPFFVYRFFQKSPPKLMKLILAAPVIAIPFCFLLPAPGLLYYPLNLVELLTLPAIFFVYFALFQAIRAKQAYAKSLTVALICYSLLGGFDIFIDLVQPKGFEKLALYSPWFLVVLSIVITLIISHKNLLYYQDATRDRLTNALRFDEFIARLESEFSRADRDKKVTLVAMIDLDKFKHINDEFGHLEGDRLLRQVADSIQSHLRQFDLMCRYGGDEFCVAACFDYREEAERFSQRLLDAINQLTFECQKSSTPVSGTIGCSVRRAGEDVSPLSLIESADQKLISGKLNKKGSVYFC